MGTASRPFNSLPRPVKRMVFAMAGVAVFFSVSSALHPERSMAAVRENAAVRQARVISAAQAEQLPEAAKRSSIQPPVVNSMRPLLGTLVGSPYFVWVYAGPAGPLYTVADRAGRILATEVDAETLYERLPEVSVETLQLQAGAPGPLMMVDPDSIQH